MLESVIWVSFHFGSAADLLCHPVSPRPARCQMLTGVKWACLGILLAGDCIDIFFEAKIIEQLTFKQLFIFLSFLFFYARAFSLLTQGNRCDPQ